MSTALRAIEPDEPLGRITDEGFLVSNAQLARLGDGDVKRGRRVLRTLIFDEKDHPLINGPTPKPDGVYVIGTELEDTALKLYLLDLAENAARVAPVDPEVCLANIRHCTRQRGGLIGLINEPAGEPVAMTMLWIDRWHWSRQHFICKMVDFVHPDHRGGPYLRQLIEFQKWAVDEWTRRFGYQVYLLNGVLATSRTKDKVRMYKRRANFVGSYFLYPWPAGADR